MRSIYIRSSCGCSMPGITKLLDAEGFAKVAVRPGRGTVKRTAVGKYVASHAPMLARRLRKALRAYMRPLKAAALASYVPVQKAQGDPPTAAEILAALQSGLIPAALVGVVTPEMIAAYRRGMAAGYAQVGFEITDDITKQMDVAAKAYAEARGGELIKDLAGTTADDMRALLGRAIEEGMSADELAAEIDDMGAFGDARAEAIARTELASAHVQGNVQGWRDTGEVDRKEWVLGDLHDIDDECDEAADAGVLELDEEFAPGVLWPPAHPNCICDVLPVLTEEETP